MADSDEKVLVIKFIGDLSDPERGLDRLEDRASRGIRVAGSRSGVAEPGVFASSPRGYSPGGSGDALGERFELRYQNRLAADMARTERAKEKEARAAERAAEAEERRAAAAERAAERVAQRTSLRVDRSFEAAEFQQFRQGIQQQERQVQGYRDLFYRTRRQISDQEEAEGAGGGRNVGDYLFRRVVLGAALYGGGRMIEGFQQLGQQQALAGSDQLAQYQATEQWYKTVSSSVPFLGAVADFFADPFGRQQTGTALTIAGAKAADELTAVRASNAEERLKLQAQARSAGEPTEYGRRRSTIESSFEETKRRIRERQAAESTAVQKNFDLSRSEIESQFEQERLDAAQAGEGNVGYQTRETDAARQRRDAALRTLNRQIGASRTGINNRFSGDIQSAEDIQKGQLREIDAGPARQMEALRGQTSSLNLQAQNRPLEATLSAQRSAGTVEMMGAQTPELSNAIAIKNVQELFETISKFMREVGNVNRSNFGAVAVNRLLLAGDERAAGVEKIRQARTDELGKLPGGVVGDALRGGVNAKYDTEQGVFTRQFDIQRSLENQNMLDREGVARQMAEGRERSAKALEIKYRAEEASSGYQQKGGPDAKRRARSAIQTGIYEEQAYLRQLKQEEDGYGVSAQNIGKGGIGAGYGVAGSRGGELGKEPLIDAIERVEAEIKQLRMDLKGID